MRTVGDLVEGLAGVDPNAPLDAFLWQPVGCCVEPWNPGGEPHPHDVPEVYARTLELDVRNPAGPVVLRLDP